MACPSKLIKSPQQILVYQQSSTWIASIASLWQATRACTLSWVRTQQSLSEPFFGSLSASRSRNTTQSQSPEYPMQQAKTTTTIDRSAQTHPLAAAHQRPPITHSHSTTEAFRHQATCKWQHHWLQIQRISFWTCIGCSKSPTPYLSKGWATLSATCVTSTTSSRTISLLRQTLSKCTTSEIQLSMIIRTYCFTGPTVAIHLSLQVQLALKQGGWATSPRWNLD